MKNIKNTNKAITTTSNEGYGLGSSKDGWDGITSEVDGIAFKHKPLTAWAVEVDGEIDPQKIRSTRALARNARDNLAETYGRTISLSVRKVLIVPIAGR